MAVLNSAIFGITDDAAHVLAVAGDGAAVGAAGDGAGVAAADAAHPFAAAVDRAKVGAVFGGAAGVGAADAAHIVVADNRALVGAAGDGAAAETADAAHPYATAGDRAFVGAAGDGAAAETADAAHIALAGDGARIGAAFDGAAVGVAADAAHIVTAGDGAGLAQGQVFDDATFAQVAHKSLPVGARFDFQALDGVARAVKGAGVFVIGSAALIIIADGGPGLAAQVDVRSQYRAGGGVLFHVLQGAVDQAREPEQVIGRSNLIDAVDLLGRYIHNKRSGGLVIVLVRRLGGGDGGRARLEDGHGTDADADNVLALSDGIGHGAVALSAGGFDGKRLVPAGDGPVRFTCKGKTGLVSLADGECAGRGGLALIGDGNGLAVVLGGVQCCAVCRVSGDAAVRAPGDLLCIIGAFIMHRDDQPGKIQCFAEGIVHFSRLGLDLDSTYFCLEDCRGDRSLAGA